jgi:hypothetical protein
MIYLINYKDPHSKKQILYRGFLILEMWLDHRNLHLIVKMMI